MLPPQTATLVISIAQSAVKLAARMDRVTAERAAVTSALVAPMPDVAATNAAKMAAELREFLDLTKGRVPDPLGTRRAELLAVLGDPNVSPAALRPWYAEFVAGDPTTVIHPDREYVKRLRAALPELDWDDEGVRLAAFHLGCGPDRHGTDYRWRLALTVIDVVAEFGAENTGLLSRDATTQTVLRDVLSRFAEDDLDDVASWGGLLRHTMRATLNGVLDARESLGGADGGHEWVAAVLGALASARDASPDGDDFVLGLVEGRGYRFLVAAALEQGAAALSGSDASAFEAIAAKVLLTAAPLAKTSQGFDEFFAAHWGDLLRAGLSGVAEHGPALLGGASPLLQKTLVAMVTELAATDDAHLLDTGTVVAMADAAVAAVAADPALLEAAGGAPWLRTLTKSIVKIAADEGLAATFTAEGARAILRDALTEFGTHPELLVERPGLVQELVGGVLTEVAASGATGLRPIADAAVAGALQAAAANPQLLRFAYGTQVAQFAGALAVRVKDGSLRRTEAAALAASVTDVLAANPQLFLEAETKLASAVTGAVLDAAGDDAMRLLAGATLVSAVTDMLSATARHGSTALATKDVDEIAEAIGAVVEGGLSRASAQLGRGIEIRALPQVLAAVAAAWLSGKLKSLDASTVRFISVFDKAVAATA